jgi:cytoskeletal protein RodZ
MRSLSRCLLCVVLALGLTSATFAQAPAEPGGGDGSLQPAIAMANRATAELPDSPGSTQAQQQSTSSQTEKANKTADQTSSNSTQQEPQKLQRPVGTAAAEAPKVSGITAAQPAGIAIAPAKQHRVRTIVIKVGAIMGAGAALGTVIALTAATPSKPPGAH